MGRPRRARETWLPLIRFIYCGWNLCAEYTASATDDLTTISALKRTYTWGLDLSGTLQGAGGVGGLLVMEDHATPEMSYPLYNGNGNIAALTDDEGNTEAWYLRTAFGKARAKGGTCTENPIRFSTKHLDSGSGLHYYAFRYYEPGTAFDENNPPKASDSFGPDNPESKAEIDDLLDKLEDKLNQPNQL